MNRAFYIVIAPAILVAAAYLGVFYRQLVPLPVALAAGGAALVAMAVGYLRGKMSSPKDA